MGRFFLFVLILFSVVFHFGAGVLFAQQTNREYVFSLKTISKQALLNNFEIQLAKYDAWIARTGQAGAQSVFDTILSGQVKYQDDQNQKTSALYGTKTVKNDYDIALSRKLPTGTTVALGMANNRTWTDAPISSASLVHDSSVGLSMAQPIGRNFFGLQDRGDIRLKKLNIDNADFFSLDRIESHLAVVQKQYWDLVFYLELFGIEKDMLGQAKRLYDLHQEKFTDGLVEKAELIAAQANYQDHENLLALALNRVQTASSTIALMLNIEEDNVQIRPQETLQMTEEEQDFLAAMKAAIANRRDYKSDLNALEARNVKLAIEKNNAWPEINLTASFKKNGLGDGFSSAVRNISSEGHPDYSVGVAVKIPLENRLALSELKAAELEKAKGILNLKYTERKIATQIADQVRDCRVYRDVALNREKIAGLQSQKLQEEEKRFARGRSTTDTLIRYQQDALNARMASAQAKHRYQTSLVDLQWKEGTLLAEYWDEKL